MWIFTLLHQASAFLVIWEISLSQRELPFDFLPHPFSTDTGSSPLIHKRTGYLYLSRDIQRTMGSQMPIILIILVAPQISATWSCIQVIISTAQRFVGISCRSLAPRHHPSGSLQVRRIYSTRFLLHRPLVSYLYWRLDSAQEHLTSGSSLLLVI